MGCPRNSALFSLTSRPMMSTHSSGREGTMRWIASRETRRRGGLQSRAETQEIKIVALGRKI